ncbi:hypothetical protein HanRHA438_Chr05g0243011 [Helianthus annuus]|uniref:Uncharacterized protein n=1 Tax=Helianthus annuus TaxID=4232 RepID=A0A251UT27_HELAN|nr:hypothetical protein HanXRQr2_Chr05g0233811 [Helianthus annuus]KAJ0571535.1 hypothetical protein HanHA300_Chr05g0191281 [Helianthus annuus]KAJ0585939.1 hypothetical protein HanHA89_Chr05g0206401 [Helianthus annuus]KAJ0920585.1 hypothetical protein HanRHA438_Chr05g0243011 [Helianthus annuus]
MQCKLHMSKYRCSYGLEKRNWSTEVNHGYYMYYEQQVIRWMDVDISIHLHNYVVQPRFKRDREIYPSLNI